MNDILWAWDNWYVHEAVIIYITSAQDKGTIQDGQTSKRQPLLRRYWEVIAFEESESYFFRSVAICNSSYTSVCDTTLLPLWVALILYSVAKNTHINYDRRGVGSGKKGGCNYGFVRSRNRAGMNECGPATTLHI